jgi:hypothetical protein
MACRKCGQEESADVRRPHALLFETYIRGWGPFSSVCLMGLDYSTI